LSDGTQQLGVAGNSPRYDRISTGQAAGAHFADNFFVTTTSLPALANLRADATPPTPVELIVRMTSTAFDPYLFLMDESTCQVIDENDDAGSTTVSEVKMNLLTIQADTNIVATSFAADAQGSYDLRVRPTLCGLEVQDLATWNNCARALVGSSCSNNPCERTATNAFTGRFCCVNSTCRTGFNNGAVIQSEPDAATCQ
jgi:hypothetical protein